MTLYREGGIEATIVDSKPHYKDSDIGRLIGLSRPRDIRRRVALLLERGEISAAQVVQLENEDDGGQVFYVDSSAAMKLAFRSNTGAAEEVVTRVMNALSEKQQDRAEAMPVDKALAAFERTLGRISREKDATIRAAYIPVLERYARMAGVPVPERADLLGAVLPSAGGLDQPRLPGV